MSNESENGEAAAALSGIRVVDFSRVLVGPFAAQLLGDFGADVIKVETPLGDETRGYEGSTGPVFAAVNRNKRSIVLDLKLPQAREIAKRLLSSADVLIHNFRVGVAERIGLGYEELAAMNPRLVYCAISGFGAVGPLAEMPAADLTVQAYSGLISFTGEPGRDPVRVPISIADLSAGLYAAIGVLAALSARERSGYGQRVETSLLESLLTLESPQIVRYLARGTKPEPLGTQIVGVGFPNQVFRVKDGMVAVAVLNHDMWLRFCRAIDASDLADDPRYRTLSDRNKRRPELVELLTDRLQAFSVEEFVNRLRGELVTCAPVLGIDEVVAEPQLDALRMITSPPGDEGTVSLVRNALNFSATPATIRRAPPELNAHVTEILHELGYSATESAEFRELGVFGT